MTGARALLSQQRELCFSPCCNMRTQIWTSAGASRLDDVRVPFRVLRRGLQATISSTSGLSTSYSQAAPSVLPCTSPRSPRRKSSWVLALVSTIDSITGFPAIPNRNCSCFLIPLLLRPLLGMRAAANASIGPTTPNAVIPSNSKRPTFSSSVRTARPEIDFRLGEPIPAARFCA